MSMSMNIIAGEKNILSRAVNGNNGHADEIKSRIDQEINAL